MNIVTVKGTCPGCQKQVVFETEGLEPKEGNCPECKARIAFLDMYLVSFEDKTAKIIPVDEEGNVTITINPV